MTAAPVIVQQAGIQPELALQALQVAGLERRGDFHAVLSACLLDRVEHRDLFDQALPVKDSRLRRGPGQ